MNLQYTTVYGNNIGTKQWVAANQSINNTFNVSDITVTLYQEIPDTRLNYCLNQTR